MTTFLVLRLVHLLAMALYVGVSLANGYAKTRADRSRNVAEIVSALTWIARFDRVFLIPASVILPVTGLWMAHLQGRAWNDPFVLTALFLFALLSAILIFAIVLEDRLHALAVGAATTATRLPGAYRRLSRIWAATGAVATALIVLTLVVMVAKRPLLFGSPD
ncbi:DUF2269 domain-containing protein [Candidatus Binatia bacterium]|nr:DUF2269 domain-containing protein [Candidatus Binatia bacterium]